MKVKWMIRMFRATTMGGAMIALAFSVSLMFAKPALALLCDPRSIEKSYKNADWVFLAEVLEAQNTRNFDDPRDHMSLQKLKLKVLKIWKGAPPETMELEIYTNKTFFIYGTRSSLEVNQSYIFALSGERTIIPFSFFIGCDHPWPANAAEKEIIWLNSTKGEGR